MDIDPDLVQRAQVLLTMEHPLSQIQDILLHEGYPKEQVQELMRSTQEALNYLVPPEEAEYANKVGIDIVHPEELSGEQPHRLDLLIDKFTGRITLLTPEKQETWRVANEVRKAIKAQRKWLH
ncbi:MAG TPA: hypothetical protein VHQ46_01140 [Desulfobacteria bacterium]|nr:hypothetical protein [Desulfobacteria bacterium]